MSDGALLDDFEPFPKLSRLSRKIVITEKLDGTNAQVIVTDDGRVLAGSRTRLITPGDDNFGFARWVEDHKDELAKALGFGRHFGEWWGAGIQRRYDQKEKRFSLFNTTRWNAALVELPPFLSVVPVLYEGMFDTRVVDETLRALEVGGSVAAPGFMKPEGVVVFHEASHTLFKKTIGDDGHKGAQAGA